MRQWEANTRRDYPREIAQVREILERTVRNNPASAHISYLPIIREIGLPENIKGQNILWKILGCVSIDTYRMGRGMLSVIVWNADKEPGNGFYDVAREDCEWPQSASNDEIFAAELRRVYEYYNRERSR